MDPRAMRRSFLAHFWAALRVVWPILSALLVVMVGLGVVVGRIEHWPLRDSLYFTFVSGLTIGYGDLVPKTLLARARGRDRDHRRPAERPHRRRRRAGAARGRARGKRAVVVAQLYSRAVSPGRSSMPPCLRLLALAFVTAIAIPVAAQAPGGTLAKIRDARAITLGYRTDAPPFSFADRDGRPAGYTVDLCNRVADSIKAALNLPELRVQWVPVTPDNRIDLVRQGRVDLECGTTTATLTRQEQVDFSNPTFVDGGGLLVRVDSKVWQLKDLASRKIAVGRNTTAARRLPEALKARGVSAQIVHVASAEEAIAMLEAGGVDAYANDRIILLGAATRARDPGRLAITDEDYSVEPTA